MRSFLILFLLVIPAVLDAADLDNRAALADLKSVQVICDVNVGDAALLLRRLELIDETYTQLLDAGVAPTIVVAFRGGASRFVTRGMAHVAAESVETKKRIQGWIDQFAQNGFRLEQCAIAARAAKIDPADFLPSIHLVQNGYVSIIAYQARGYAYLPMD